MSSLDDLTKQRLKNNPVIYTVVFRHDDEGMSFVVHDIGATDEDRLAVALDFEVAAEVLKKQVAGLKRQLNKKGQDAWRPDL